MENKTVNSNDIPQTNFNPRLLMLNSISRFREDYRMLFPNDVKINQQITELLHSIAWQIKDSEG